MLRRTLPLLSAVKSTTGLVGLEVLPNAKEVLTDIYTKTLSDIAASKIPEDHGWRTWIEPTYKYRLTLTQDSKLSVAEVEKEIDCGQLEELVEHAKDELDNLKTFTDIFENWDGVRHDK